MRKKIMSTAITGGLFLTVTLTWGTTWMAMKIALISFPPIFATGLRFLLAAPALALLAKATKVPLLFPQGNAHFSSR
ncbi:EamA family transporter [Citrobacter koseri]|uniref:EamA family transporter n=1 Tax=Citrobacter koseri TaxID=545 RepID=UPI000E04AEE3|nr:EamA family transporter [Citrobacter koseri]STB73313.1 putative DMT superfamily transporter inner membrane protein [Citrobacter koseri]STT23492.1 putative PhoPQ-activated integral membrane protein [Citrobacter koseri]